MSSRQAQFAALVQAYSADLYRFAFWLCRHRANAEDLVQETFLRAWRGLGNLREETSAKAWLLTILRREHARGWQRRSHDVVIDDTALADIPAATDTDPDIGVLRQALYRLPDEYREPLVLQVIGGFSAEEIGTMIDASVPAVLTRLFRARQKLRQEMAHLTGDTTAERYDTL